jgi:hypothetical protein
MMRKTNRLRQGESPRGSFAQEVDQLNVGRYRTASGSERDKEWRWAIPLD